MFSKIIVAFSTLAVLATAIPTPGGSSSVSQCNNSGYSKCCNTVTEYNSTTATEVYGVLGIAVDSVDALVGLGCVDIVGGACSNTAVCCGGNKANGLVNVQCVPIVL